MERGNQQEPTMTREPHPGQPDPKTDDAVAAHATGSDTAPPAGPVDGDWAQRERAAAGQPEPKPFDDGDEPYGDPSKLKDKGPLESLGEAVSTPARDAADSDPGDAAKRS
jgi:hypothetical protein